MKKAVKWITRIIVAVFLLFILLLIIIHTGPVKRFVRNKLQAYLSSKIKTEVRIDAVNYLLPKWVEIDGVFLRDQAGDTLLYGNKVHVDINMFKLLKGEYEIRKIALGAVTLNVSRKEKDSSFNYQFIIDAFAGKKTNEPEKKSSLSLSLDEIDITHSAFKWNDLYGGTILATRVGGFNIKMDSIDINKMLFGIHTCNIDDMVFDMRLINLHVPKKVDSAISAANTIPLITLAKLTINRSHFGFNGETLGINTNDDITEMMLTGLKTRAPLQLSLERLQLDRSSLSLARTDMPIPFVPKSGHVTEQHTTQQKNANTTTDTTAGNLVLNVKQVSFTGNTIAFDDHSKKVQQKGFDMNHIAVHSLNADVSGISSEGKKMKVLVKSMSGIDKSGFTLNALHGDVVMNDSVITAKDIILKTPGSTIKGDLLLYPSSIAENYHGNLQSKIVFTNNVIARKDVELLIPSVTDKYSKQLQGVSYVYANASMTGNAGKMLIKNITLHSDKNDIYLNASGTLRDAMSKNKLQYDLVIAKLTATKSFIDPFVNTNGKQVVNLPPSINITGKLNGNMEQVTNDLVITSSYGTATVKGQVANFANPDKLRYNMRLLAKDLETGKWISKDSLMGKLNGTINIKGSGIDYKTADINAAVDISSFRLQQHNYSGIQFNINGIAGSYDVKGKILDSLLRLNMNVHTTFNQKYPTAVGKLNIENADLNALGFYQTPLRIKTKADLQLKDLSPDNLNAFLRLDSITVYKDNAVIRTDSLLVKGIKDSGKTIISLVSPMAYAQIKGDYRYDELPSVLQEYITRYTKEKKGAAAAVSKDENFTMAVDLKPDPVYALLLPGLFFDKNIHAAGKFDTKQKDSTLSFYLTAPVLGYGSNHFANLRASVNGVGDSIKYAIMLDTLRSSSFLLYTTSVTGGFSNDHLSAAIVTNDPKKKPKYALAITGSVDNDNYIIHLEDKLTLNYADWAVDKQNKLSYGNAGVNISDFKISKNAETIAINSTTATPNAPLDIKIDRFSLSNITGLFNRDSLEIAGILNAQVKVDGLGKAEPVFDGKIKIDSLAYQSEPVGNVELNAQSTAAESVTFDGSLTGRGSNVTVKGNYNQSKIDAQVNLSPIQFAAIEPFTGHTLARSSGKLTGNISITGDVKNPQWNGSILFDSAHTQLAKYGTALNLSGQKIDIQYPVITFNQFTIRDSLNHPFIIDGTLKQENGSFNTNLTVKTKNFTALDNTSITNAEIYGKAIVDVDVTVTGPATAPDITGSIGLKDKSQVTYVRQQDVASAKDREGVMEFVNIDTMMTKAEWKKDTILTSTKASASMLNYNLNIDINKNAEFIVIIDPLTRDELHVKGAAQLTAAVNPNGDVSITGAYNLSSGSYQLNNKFLKRKFLLQEGSTIVLSGDPANAEANITAVYDIDASPYDLVANEVSGDINGDDKLYKQKLPFQVILKITGKITEPKLSFDVQIQENTNGINYDMQTTIENKLQQIRADQSTMDKQVFALLVMGRFIGEQSQDFFAGSNGGGVNANDIVKGSVSRFLSDAISNAAAGLIKGVDVDVNLKTETDYATAQERTDLDVALSKRFLNDRLNITVGKSFTVDGEDPLAKGQDNGNVQFLPDITTTYKLSKDGRYMIKAYQKNEYEAILDGYFIETGVAFTLTMDYNKFKEIFEKKKKVKKNKTDIKKNPDDTNPTNPTNTKAGS